MAKRTSFLCGHYKEILTSETILGPTKVIGILSLKNSEVIMGQFYLLALLTRFYSRLY